MGTIIRSTKFWLGATVTTVALAGTADATIQDMRSHAMNHPPPVHPGRRPYRGAST